jgi:uncharacterized protein (DUF302 family)
MMAYTLTFIAGAVSGILVTVLLVYLLMPGMMIVTHQSRLNFDDTMSSLEAAVTNAGWGIAGKKDMNASMGKRGVEFGPRVEMLEICQPAYAKDVLTDARHVACLMPCSIAVYEDDAGRVMLSKMNTGLMGKMFGGTVARVMGGSVARDEQTILEGIVQ